MIALSADLTDVVGCGPSYRFSSVSEVRLLSLFRLVYVSEKEVWTACVVGVCGIMPSYSEAPRWLGRVVVQRNSLKL